jgi:N-acetylmuramoyl-L-alanine amidase
MPESVIVTQGDCITSIACERGFFPRTIWEHPENASLKQKRRNPNALMPGDTVVVPDKGCKELSKPDAQRHRFRRLGVPARLRVQVCWGNRPRANEPFTLTVEGEVFQGHTDGDGWVDQAVSPLARSATLLVGGQDDQERYDLALGEIDPVDEVSGAQGRLENLGFRCEEEQGSMGPNTRQAIRQFQAVNGLTPTGELDAPTRAKLVEVHGG